MNAFRLSSLAVLLTFAPALEPRLLAESKGNRDPVLYWNEIALDTVVYDHSFIYGLPEKGGPTRTARALAIVHIAMFDAVNVISGKCTPYIAVTGFSKSQLQSASLAAAVAQAARDTLVALYPNQTDEFDRRLKKELADVSSRPGRDYGVAIGARAAANILALRTSDGGDDPNLPFPSDPNSPPGVHQPDPLNPGQGLLTPMWGLLTPFAMDDVTHFHAPAPPRPDSSDFNERMEYFLAYEQVRLLGGDGVTTPTLRTAEQTQIGIFWGYDGSIGLGVPPRMYNQIARVIAKQRHNSVAENARLFALVNIAMADAGIASWFSKYDYGFWRPIVAIRRGGTGQLHDNDGNELTVGDTGWTPLGAPASNGSNGGVNFTPNFPAYTSGHATFGAAAFRTLANLYGDDYQFSFMSDEFNGRTTDSLGLVRPRVVRHFESFSQAARENADSRIYLGIHWSFDADAGLTVGNGIADYTFDNLLRPAR